MTISAYEKGFQDYYNGYKFKDNPYIEQDARENWFDGFLNAEKEYWHHESMDDDYDDSWDDQFSETE